MAPHWGYLLFLYFLVCAISFAFDKRATSFFKGEIVAERNYITISYIFLLALLPLAIAMGEQFLEFNLSTMVENFFGRIAAVLIVVLYGASPLIIKVKDQSNLFKSIHKFLLIANVLVGLAWSAEIPHSSIDETLAIMMVSISVALLISVLITYVRRYSDRMY